MGAELQNAATEKPYEQSVTHHLVHVYEILKTLIWFHFFNHKIFCGWLRPELRPCPHLFWQRLCSLSDNLNGSAGSMECEGILHTLCHTESLQQLRYTGYLGDDDSKSHSAFPMLTLLYINCMISKCRGHVQKRMGRKQIDMDSPFL